MALTCYKYFLHCLSKRSLKCQLSVSHFEAKCAWIDVRTFACDLKTVSRTMSAAPQTITINSLCMTFAIFEFSIRSHRSRFSCFSSYAFLSPFGKRCCLKFFRPRNRAKASTSKSHIVHTTLLRIVTENSAAFDIARRQTLRVVICDYWTKLTCFASIGTAQDHILNEFIAISNAPTEQKISSNLLNYVEFSFCLFAVLSL